MANWGITLGIGGTLLMTVLLWGLIVPLLTLRQEFAKLDGIVAEFRAAYAQKDAASIFAKMSQEGRAAANVDAIRSKLEEALAAHGPFDEFKLDWWTMSRQSADKTERVTRFPYELKGPRGDFRLNLYCRKGSDDVWRLERFEFVR
jgi:hypothetical protein